MQLNRIKAVLAEKQKKAKDVYEVLELNRVTFSKYSRNAGQPTLETLFKIAIILDCDVCELINTKGKEHITDLRVREKRGPKKKTKKKDAK